MNKNINLCKILKGHEGETFYSIAFGNVTLAHVSNKNIIVTTNDPMKSYTIPSSGYYSNDGECMLFPSIDQRDWNIWCKKQKTKIPKIWNDLMNQNIPEVVEYNFECSYTSRPIANKPIEKSALAFLKIYQLIELGYNGNSICNGYSIYYENRQYIIGMNYPSISTFGFKEYKDAEEFLSYKENVTLLDDYYMIPEEDR